MALSAACDVRPGTIMLVGTGLCASGVTIYKGAQLTFNGSGYLRPARDNTADNGYAGIAAMPYDNSANASTQGTSLIQFEQYAQANTKLTYSAANNGKELYATGDDTAATTASHYRKIGVQVGCGHTTAYSRYSPIIPSKKG